MKKITKLTEDDLNRIVKKVLSEQTMPTQTGMPSIEACFSGLNLKVDSFNSCKALKNSMVVNRTPDPKLFTACVGEVTAALMANFKFDQIPVVAKCIQEKLKPSVVQY